MSLVIYTIHTGDNDFSIYCACHRHVFNKKYMPLIPSEMLDQLCRFSSLSATWILPYQTYHVYNILTKEEYDITIKCRSNGK
jgi:hypothetical protein